MALPFLDQSPDERRDIVFGHRAADQRLGILEARCGLGRGHPRVGAPEALPVQRQRTFLHLMAEALAKRRGIAHRLHHVGVQGPPVGRGGGDADAERAGVRADLLQIGGLRHRGVVDIASHPAADRIQIGGGLAHRVGDGEEGRAAVPVVGVGVERDPAARGLQPDQPAVGGRHPGRARAVARVDEGHHSRCQRRGGAAAGAARRPLKVPGVVGAAEEGGLRRQAPAELGRVAAAEQHEAGLLDAPRVGHVGGADEVLEVAAAVDKRDALPQRAEVLEQEGHALERAVGQRGVGCGLAAIVEERDRDRVQRRIKRLDAADRLLGEFAWRSPRPPSPVLRCRAHRARRTGL